MINFDFIQNLNIPVKTTLQGGFYMACALGLHRTDMTLAYDTVNGNGFSESLIAVCD